MQSSIRTLSQLPEISSNALPENAYFETSVPGAVYLDRNGNDLPTPVYRYVSRKIEKKELVDNFSNSIREKLYTDTGIPTDNSKNFGKAYNDFGNLISGTFTLSGQKTFTTNPKHTDGIANFDTADERYSVNLSALKRYTNQNAAPSIGSGFGFITTLSGTNNSTRNETLFNIDTQSKRIYNTPRYVFSPEMAKIISQNEFIFNIESGKRESKVWVAPASGIFTCYGWLDEINNNSVSNEKRWVALLGYQSQLKVWTALQVQPFIKNNYLSYVSFTFPVHKGLKLKIQTGFPVGSNSNKYFRSSSSLANSVANAFLGGVYTGLSVDFDNFPKGNYSLCADPYLFALSAELQEYIKHEASCDISTNNRLSSLEKRLATNDTIDALCAAIDNRVKYIDTSTYTSAPLQARLKIYNRMFNTDAAGGDANYLQECLNDQGKQSTAVPLQYCELTSLTERAFRHYYAPPEFSQDLESGETGYVERAYTIREDPPYGRVFSDGKYMFYCVSQDCTAIVRLHGDFTGRGASGIAGYMLCPQSSTTNMYAVTIGKSVEWIGNLTDPQGYISLPVKKGTIFMFYPWHTERREDSRGGLQQAMKNNDALGRGAWLALNVPAVVPNADSGLTRIDSLYGRDTYTNKATINGQTIEYNSYAVWTADQTQRNKLVGSGVGQFDYLFGNADSHGPDACSIIATVVELP